MHQVPGAGVPEATSWLLCHRVTVDRLAEDWTSMNGPEFLEAPCLALPTGAEHLFMKGHSVPESPDHASSALPTLPPASPPSMCLRDVPRQEAGGICSPSDRKRRAQTEAQNRTCSDKLNKPHGNLQLESQFLLCVIILLEDKYVSS